MSHLSLTLLGAFEAVLDGESVTAFGSDKARGLLAFLAIESDRPHRRSELAGMFWTDLSEKRAAHNLSQTLFRLRNALNVPKGPAKPGCRPLLLISRQDIQFNPHSDHQLDVALFTELLRSVRQHHHPRGETCVICMQWLHQAANIYRGDLLAGFFLRGSVGFEEWQLIQQERLHQLAVEIMARLAMYHEIRNEYELAQRYAGQLVALEPWHEQGHLQLMRALARAGQTTAALEKYAGYRRILAEEFDLSPSAEAKALFEQIQAGQVGRRAASAGDVSSLSHSDRRQVTALICSLRDLAGGDELEELYQQLNRRRPVIQTILDRYLGHLQQWHGDEYTVYFGYPQAYEDAALRAVHAGLAMTRDAGLIRVGIHTDTMIVSGSDKPDSTVHGPVGSAPSVARGCQALAEPGTVLITADTERLVRGWFDCQTMGYHTLPGLTAPVEVYRVVGEGDEQSRLDRLVWTQNLTSFVGRRPELDRLLACYNEVQNGNGQVVLISGEPGIGKSRLLRECRTIFLEKRQAETGDWLESHCSPYFQNTSLYPIIGLLEQSLDLEPGDGPEVKRDRLNGLLARSDLTHPAASWLLSQLLGLSGDSPAPKTITSDQRERMREMLVVLLQKQALRQPLVVVVEDLHWSDPTTVEWLGRSFDALVAVPCLVLLTCRTSFISPWPPRARLLPLTLGPLSPAQAERLVSNIAGDRTLPDEFRQRIVGRTDGVPLFVEELTKTILDQQASKTAKTPRITQIPATLRDSLMERLDRAGSAKETAQWAAVLGREFSYPILQAVVPYDERHLQDDLKVLAEADLVYAQDRSTRVRFAFKHALIQEAAYASLLRQTRQDYHRRIAETLDNRFPQVAETRPEVLAEHYANAGLQERAVDLWLRAGELATAQAATLEARNFFNRALEQIDGDSERRWQALLGRETVLALRQEREAQKEDIEALLEVAEAIGGDMQRAEAYKRQAAYALRLKDFKLMLHAAEAAITAADRAGIHTLEAQAMAMKVIALTYIEDWSRAKHAVEETLTKLPEVADDMVQAYVLGDLGFYYARVGDIFLSLSLLQRGSEAARRVGDGRKESRFAVNIGFILARLGRYVEARAAFEEGLALAEAIGDQALQTSLRYNLSYVLWCSGDQEKALAMGERALEEFEAAGRNAVGHACCLAYLGIYLEDAGRVPIAAEYLSQARAIYIRTGVDSLRMEAQALEARCVLALGRQGDAQRLAMEVWTHLHEQGTLGMDFPSRVYLCVADVLEGVETPGISACEAISAGYRDLMQYAAEISDAAWRQSFLENVTENREILMRWQELITGSLSGD